MAENLGEVNLKIKPDEQATVNTYKRAGKVQANEFSRQMSAKFQATASSMAQKVGGSGGGRSFNMLFAGGGFGPKMPKFTRSVPAGLTGTVSTGGRAGLLAGGRAAAAGMIAKATASLAAVPPVAIAVGVTLAGLAIVGGKLIKRFKKLSRWSQEVANEMHRLAAVSPMLARRAAVERLGQFQRDRRRAAFGGAHIAYGSMLRERLANNLAPFRDFLMIFKQINVNGFLTLLNWIMEGLRKFAAMLVWAHKTITQVGADFLGWLAGLLEQLPFGAGAGLAATLRGIEAGVTKVIEIEDAILKRLKDIQGAGNFEEANRIMTRDLDVLSGKHWNWPRHATPEHEW
jgi:hypothetical protein